MGEGDYIAPHREYGFGYLDDVRIYRRVLSAEEIRINATKLPVE